MQAFIFFALLVSWAFLKLRNVLLIMDISSITGMSYKEVRKNMMRDLKRQSHLTYIIYIINLISIAIFALVLLIPFAEDWLSGVLTIFLTFGFALLAIFDDLMNLNIMYFPVCTYLISGIYINALGYKKLKSVEFLNLLQQSKSIESDTIATQDNTLTKDAKMSELSEKMAKADKIAKAGLVGFVWLLFLLFIVLMWQSYMFISNIKIIL